MASRSVGRAQCLDRLAQDGAQRLAGVVVVLVQRGLDDAKLQQGVAGQLGAAPVVGEGIAHGVMELRRIERVGLKLRQRHWAGVAQLAAPLLHLLDLGRHTLEGIQNPALKLHILDGNARPVDQHIYDFTFFGCQVAALRRHFGCQKAGRRVLAARQRKEPVAVVHQRVPIAAVAVAMPAWALAASAWISLSLQEAVGAGGRADDGLHDELRRAPVRGDDEAGRHTQDLADGNEGIVEQARAGPPR